MHVPKISNRISEYILLLEKNDLADDKLHYINVFLDDLQKTLSIIGTQNKIISQSKNDFLVLLGEAQKKRKYSEPFSELSVRMKEKMKIIQESLTNIKDVEKSLVEKMGEY